MVMLKRLDRWVSSEQQLAAMMAFVQAVKVAALRGWCLVGLGPENMAAVHWFSFEGLGGGR